MNAGPAQMGSLGKFLPKGFIPLRDAIEQLGSELVSGWTGDEQTAEVWEDAQSSSVWKETENWLADQIGQIFMEEWGTTFTQAASDYAQHPIERFSMLELHLTLHKEEIEDLKVKCGDDSTAGGLFIVRLAAKRILEDARHNRLMSQRPTEIARGLLISRDSIDPPMMDVGSGLEPIELSEENLNRIEAQANEFFAKREEDRAIIRQRTIEVWALLRPELHAGSIACITLKKGKTVAVDPAIWATNDAEALFRECTYDGSEIFVSDKAVSLSRSGSEAGESETSRLNREVADSTGGASAPPEFVPTPSLRSAPGRRNMGVVAAKVYLRVFSDGHERLGHTWESAIVEIVNRGAPKVSKRTLQRGLETLRQKKFDLS